MVRVSYCPNCQKAYRFHFKRKLICRTCKEPFEYVKVPRSKYFLVQIPFLIIGFILIFYSAYVLSSPTERFAEILGYFILGFAIVLFALAFQMMDNKKMEILAKEIGRKEFGMKDKDEQGFGRFRFTEKETEDIEPERVIKKPKKELKPEDLFFQPNKPQRTQPVKKNVPIQRKAPKKVRFEDIIEEDTKKKPARKIRKAL